LNQKKKYLDMDNIKDLANLNSKKIIEEIIESEIDKGMIRLKELTIVKNEQLVKEILTAHIMLNLEKYIEWK
jgi:hypothetical protein